MGRCVSQVHGKAQGTMGAVPRPPLHQENVSEEPRDDMGDGLAFRSDVGLAHRMLPPPCSQQGLLPGVSGHRWSDGGQCS